MTLGNPGRLPRASAVVALALAALTAVAYGPVHRLGFVFDDGEYILGNPWIKGGLTPQAVRWAFTGTFSANWHPVTWLSHLADVELFGLAPAGPHAVNLLLHLANTVLLFGLFRALTGALWRPALTAALFAIHPLHVESVAWISERKDLLSACFGLLALHAYRRFAASPGRRRYALVAAWFALSLLSKPMLITFPVALLLLDFWPLGRMTSLRDCRTLAAEKVPLFAFAAAAAAVTWKVQGAWGALNSWESIPPAARLANAFAAYGTYLQKSVWPHNLAAYYPYSRFPGPSVVFVAGAAVLLATLTAAALRARRTQPFLAAGWLWFPVTTLPVIGIVQVGNQAMADRYTYLPLVGPFFAAAWGLAALGSRIRWGRRAVAISMTAALTALSIATRAQVGRWESDLTLFTHAVAVTTDNYFAHNNLALALVADGRVVEAKAHFLEALRIRPAFADAHANLGNLLVAEGKAAEAVARYREAMRLRPSFAGVRVNLGLALRTLGDPRGAEASFREALLIDPGLYAAHINLGNLLSDTGRPGEALAPYHQAQRVRPDDPDVRFNRGLTLERLGRRREAADDYREALRLRPNYPAARERLARLTGGT
jgi:tetratricopeptide (TPR) repeat protein